MEIIVFCYRRSIFYYPYLYNVQMDAAVLGDRLPEGTQKPLRGPGSPLSAVPALGELESACRVGIL